MMIVLTWHAVCSLCARKVTVTLYPVLTNVKRVHTSSSFTQAESVHIRCMVLQRVSPPCRYHATHCSVRLTTRCTWMVRHVSLFHCHPAMNDWFISWIETEIHSINQSIKTNLYSALRRRRIRGACWTRLGRVFTFAVRTIKQFSL